MSATLEKFDYLRSTVLDFLRAMYCGPAYILVSIGVCPEGE